MRHIQTIENFQLWAEKAQSRQELVNAFIAALREYGFEGMSISTYTPSGLIVPEYTDFGNAPPGWIDQYFENNYGEIDPVIVLGRALKKSYLWDDALRKIKLSDEQKAFLKEAKAIAGTGMTVPLREKDGRRTVVNMYTSEATKDLHPYANHAHLLAIYFHSYYRKFVEIEEGLRSQVYSEGEDEHCFLNGTEKAILHLTLHGKTSYEISDILNLNMNEVFHFSQSAIEKLNSMNIDQASQRAYDLGFILGL